MRRALVAFVLAMAALSDGPAGLAAPSWDGVISTYLAGDFDQAVYQARRMLGSVYGALQKSSLKPFNRRRFQAGLAVQTEATFAVGWPVTCVFERLDREQTPFGVHRRDRFLELLEDSSVSPPDYAFLQNWYLMVAAYNQGRGSLRKTLECLNTAPAVVREAPAALLALGALYENAWQWSHDDGLETAGVATDLTLAERAYQEAVDKAPTLAEAKLRLARVLTHRGATAEALVILEAITVNDDPYVGYLSRLFAGQAHEERGDYARAAEAYQAALLMQEGSQSARVALAHLAHLQGQRSTALAAIEALGTSRQADAPVDPWLWYGKGTARMADAYLAQMRAAVLRPN